MVTKEIPTISVRSMLPVKIKSVLINSPNQLGVRQMVFQKTLQDNSNLTLVGNFVPSHLDILLLQNIVISIQLPVQLHERPENFLSWLSSVAVVCFLLIEENTSLCVPKFFIWVSIFCLGLNYQRLFYDQRIFSVWTPTKMIKPIMIRKYGWQLPVPCFQFFYYSA